MMNLKPDECRVLGVLVEKAQTVASQYPITLNALVTGCNQKNNRFPVTSLNEEQVMDALDGLRAKKLAAEVMMSGSRVSKYRHLARETLAVSTLELILITELLLRGPQSLGELRGHASRMHQLESMEGTHEILKGLMAAQGDRPALIKEVPPPPGSRGMRYVQLLCPDLHRLDIPASADEATGTVVEDDRIARLEERVELLAQTVRALAAKASLPLSEQRGL